MPVIFMLNTFQKICLCYSGLDGSRYSALGLAVAVFNIILTVI